MMEEMEMWWCIYVYVTQTTALFYALTQRTVKQFHYNVEQLTDRRLFAM